MALVLWDKWTLKKISSPVWVRILVDPNYFPLGIALIVSEVFDELMQSNSVTPGGACESSSGLYAVHS